MIITRVSKIRKSLVLLYLDGEPAFKIDKETFFLSHFGEGDEIDDEELFELIKTSDYKRAKEKALYLLGLKNYSQKMLEQKLSEDVSREIASEVAEQMCELGLVDDRNYAEICVRDMVNIKKFGVQRIKTELYKRKIDREIIDEVLSETEFDNDENIISILERKYPMWQEDDAVKRRAVAFLQRRGYRYGEIRDAMSLEFY